MKDNKQFWECGRKKFYRTKSDADAAMMRLKPWGEDRLNTYKCRWCPGYHVGNKPQRKVCAHD